MIIIGYNHNGIPISIVKANSIELARALWQGANVNVHTVKSATLDVPNYHPTGVYEIMKTESRTVSERFSEDEDVVIVLPSANVQVGDE